VVTEAAPDIDLDLIRELCLRSIHRLASPLPEASSAADVERIMAIVIRNIASGRAARVMATSSAAAGFSSPDLLPGDDLVVPLQRYIDRVASFFFQERQRVDGLAAGEEAAWTQLQTTLTERAMHILARLPASAAHDAADFAQETCAIIFEQTFPFDVPFDAWAALILRNQILARRTRSRDPSDRDPDLASLDQPKMAEADPPFSLYDLVSDASKIDDFARVEVQEWLLTAIARLPTEPQRQVIIGSYFYEWSDEEIAARLSKTRQAVYNLRHRALCFLKKLLTTTSHDGRRGF